MKKILFLLIKAATETSKTLFLLKQKTEEFSSVDMTRA